METAPFVLLLILLSYPGTSNGLCNLENGTTAYCSNLEDVKYMETYHLEMLKASVAEPVLRPGYFDNLSSLRHLDLSNGNLEHVEAGSFRPLNNLKSLNLAENRIQYLELVSVEGLHHLHALNLRKNNLKQLPPALALLTVLKHLDVQSNPLQCNCATLRVRDLIVKRGVKISKKAYCAGPESMKGMSLFKPDATVTCNLEEQDREMQRDEGYKDTAEEEEGSGNSADQFDDDSDGFVEVPSTSESIKELEIETPYPETSENSMSSSSESLSTSKESETPETSLQTTVSLAEEVSTTQAASPLPKAIEEVDEILLDLDGKKEQSTLSTTTTDKMKVFKDALFYPVEGSGDEEEGSGEGSGTGVIFHSWKKDNTIEKSNDVEEESQSGGEGLFSTIWNGFFGPYVASTEVPDTTKDPDLEEEHFIDASSTQETQEEGIVQKKIKLNEGAVPTTVAPTTEATSTPFTNGVELVTSQFDNTSKLDSMKVSAEDENEELAKVSPAKQSKKGMGPYVVLGALLIIVAILIGFAAYKGDFCKKKRKRGDIERGTELKDMQKALLDTGNSVQPKIASNGTMECAPLVEDAQNHEEIKPPNDHQIIFGTPESSKDTLDHADPVKPPRRSTPQENQKVINETPGQDSVSLKDDSLSGRTSSIEPTINNGQTPQMLENNDPPSSPGAQRVKITLQENPDSVPRTPILITRTMAGENLVKMP